MSVAERLSDLFRLPDPQEQADIKEAALKLRKTAIEVTGNPKQEPRMTLPRYQSDSAVFRLAPDYIQVRAPYIEDGERKGTIDIFISDAGKPNAKLEKKVEERTVTVPQELTPGILHEITQTIETHGVIRLDTKLRQPTQQNQAA